MIGNVPLNPPILWDTLSHRFHELWLQSRTFLFLIQSRLMIECFWQQMQKLSIPGGIRSTLVVRRLKMASKFQNSHVKELQRGSLHSFFFFFLPEDHSMFPHHNCECFAPNISACGVKGFTEAFCCVFGVLPWPSLWEFCCSCCCCCLLANFFIWKEGVRLVRTPPPKS